MAILARQLTLSLPIRDVLAYVGTLALVEGRTEAAQAARDLIGHVGTSEAELVIPVDHALCQVADALRAKHDTDGVALLERLIAAIKVGTPQRVVVGRVTFGGTSIHDQLERIAKLAGV